jgi:hypothetical protein
VAISKYIAELRKISEHCLFGAGLSDALWDRLVCGMHSESTHKWLLTEKVLTLERALNIAFSMETTANDASEWQPKSIEL